MFFSSLNNSETIRVKDSFYLKCVYLICLVLDSAPCACILVVYVDTHGSNLWGISFEMHILDTCIKLKKLISCSFWFSVAGDQTQCLTHGIQVPYPWGIIPTLESLWKDFYLKKKNKNRAGNMSSSGFEWIHFSVHFDIIYTGLCSSMLMNYH